jgi:adenine-specific DNA methylase
MPSEIVGHTTRGPGRSRKEPIAAGIATHLYQDARVQNSPLQAATLPNDYFDVHVSNVPFGRIQIFDPAFTSPARRPMTTSVHNYYFGKALDTARPGGLVAFVTSRFTMDARSDTVRRYLAAGFDLLGAIRLPDHAFSATAGTDVVTISSCGSACRARRRAAHWTQSVPHEHCRRGGPPIH